MPRLPSRSSSTSAGRNGAASVRSRGKFANGNAGQRRKNSAVTQVGEHAVDPVGGFVDLFDEQDRTAQVRHERRTHRGIEDAQVAAQQQALCATTSSDPGRWRGRISLEQHRLATHQHMAHTTDEQAASFQLRSDRPMNGRQARLVPQRTVQRGDVGKAGHQLGVATHRVHIHLLNDPLYAITPASADDRADFRISQRGVEVGEPLFIGPRIERIAAQRMRIDPWTQPHPSSTATAAWILPGSTGPAGDTSATASPARRARGWRVFEEVAGIMSSKR